MTGLANYLRDASFDASNLPPRSFDTYGNGYNDFDTNNNFALYTTAYPNQYPTQYPNQVSIRYSTL